MKYDFHAQYPLASWDSVTQALAIQFLVRKQTQLPAIASSLSELIDDDWERLLILSQATATERKEEAGIGAPRRESGAYKYWLETSSKVFIKQRMEMMRSVGVLPALPSSPSLPFGFWAIQFTFILRKPYMTREDSDFYILDNPIRKDKVFKVPVAAASSWKGLLRWTIMHTRLALKKGSYP